MSVSNTPKENTGGTLCDRPLIRNPLWVPSRLRISPSIPGNPKSRDDTEVLCYALQALWCDTGTRNDVLALIQEAHGEEINAANGKNIIPAGHGLLADRVKFGCLP